MSFERNPFESKTEPALVSRHIDDVRVGDLVSDKGLFKPILEKIVEPDHGGTRLIIKDGDPRYVGQDEEDKNIEVVP